MLPSLHGVLLIVELERKLSRMSPRVKADVVTIKTGPMESQFIVWQMISVTKQRVVNSY